MIHVMVADTSEVIFEKLDSGIQSQVYDANIFS